MRNNRADLIIVDGKNLLWRTHDVDQHRFARDGNTAIGGAEGFLRLLIKLRQEFGGIVAIAWEGSGINWRMRTYPEYKANRSKKTPEQRAENEQVMRQIPILQELLSKLGIRQFQGIDCEGDDVMATLAEQTALRTANLAGHAGFTHTAQVLIYSKDRDLLQMVNDKRSIRQLVPINVNNGTRYFGSKEANQCSLGRIMIERDVLETMGVTANQIIDYKALAGDSGDHISGIPGFGPMKAIALIDRFGDLEAILNAAADGRLDAKCDVKLRNKLLDNVDLARRCRIVASVKRDAKIEEVACMRNEDDAHACMIRLGMMGLANTAEFQQCMEIAS